MASDSTSLMKNMRRILLAKILVLLSTLIGYGQIPVISNISASALYPKGSVVITGSGFSSNPAQLQVWFGQSRGTILSCSEFSIEVQVPPSATYSNIEVINTASRKSTTSTIKFLPSFYGEAFDATKFAAPASFTSLNELRDLASGDLNNDGKPDIVATKFSAATDILILQNNSTGPGNVSFSKISYTLNYASDHPLIGDVDCDGFQDLILTKGGASNRNAVFVIRNISSTGGSINFNMTPFTLPLDATHVAMRSALRDFNGDGRPELVVTNLTNNTLYIFMNDPAKPLGANPFNTTPVKITVTDMASTYGLDVQDFDGDGKADIMLNAVASANFFIMRNKTTGTAVEFDAPQKITLPGQLRNSMSADINRDGKFDIITSSTGTNQVLISLNQSSAGSFAFSSSPIILTADSAPWGVSPADLDGDGDLDIAVANQTSSAINVFVHDGNLSSPSFAKQTITAPRPARNLIAADVDSDGKPEIAAASFVIGSYAVDVYRNMICHKPKILNEEPIFICNNPVELKAVPAINVTFEWKQGASSVKNSTDPFASITAGGSYTVSTSSINPAGECTNVTSAAINVTGSAGSVPQDPSITVNTPLCSGATLNLSTPDVAAGASYKWNGPNNWTTTTTTPSTSIPNVTSSNAGEYTVQIISGNCKSNVSTGKLVDVVAVDNFNISSNSPTNSACEPNAVKLSVNSVSGFTYAWKRNTDPYPAATTVNTYDAFLDGDYWVRITNATLGCPARELGPVKVALLSAPVADFSIGNPRCANAPIEFTNLSTIDPAADGASPVAPVQWAWNFGNSKSSTEKNPSNIYTNAAVSYNVTLTVSYLGVAGCSSSKVIPLTVTASSLPVITSSAESLCPGQSATLSVSGSFTALAWEHGPTGSPINITAPGTYTVNATDANGCVVPKSVEIESKDVPVLVIAPETPAVPAGQSVQLMATGAHLFEWSPAESLSNPNIPDPIATPLTTTTYTVKGSYTDGCSSQAQVTVLVDVSQIDLNPPLAFSPNGDTDNERWEIPGIEKYPDCTLNIFDGRGRRIYQKKGYDNQWDGTYEGKPVPSGTYYYVFGCPNTKPLTGSVLVFR
jgi:gliding motility-associated-like protein